MNSDSGIDNISVPPSDAVPENSLSASDTQGLSPSIYQLHLLAYGETVSLVTERRVDLDLATGGIIKPDDMGDNNSSGGLSPIFIIIPVAIVVGGGLVFLILKGSGAKK
ncbi:MAG: hypothetical protein P3T54_03635 [Dehalogenimonas sp.]|uniref:Uncharacterized protein n=1 Tax=Candidatus Dehalogenimonas loeffleri TaxID=3127115 RepID=A0ABZ2J981_9CHLR|nr:hypothetical protein [Dehalogenimonas sp.]